MLGNLQVGKLLNFLKGLTSIDGLGFECLWDDVRTLRHDQDNS